MSAPWMAIGHRGPAEGTDAKARRNPELRLIPVFERLPQAQAEPSPPGQGEPLPLLIGLGEAARGLIDRLGQHAGIPPAAGLYRSGHPAQTGQPPWLQQRLELCDCALLLIDTADPPALAMGQVWARQLLDVISQLSTGTCARTTAVQWCHEPIMPVSFRAAQSCLDLRRPRTLIAWVHANEDFTIGEYADIQAHCEGCLPDDDRALIALNLHPEWTSRRRVLSLALVGERPLNRVVQIF
ncbi:MAG: hypothetical protein EOM21_20325 [Gammaproteobacteria bacterium]|nr:hypothetical protein [Gammaproteobacteria bacterium]